MARRLAISRMAALSAGSGSCMSGLLCIETTLNDLRFAVETLPGGRIFWVLLTIYAGKCEVVRVGPDIFSFVLTGVGFLRSEPGETAFGKTGEG